MTTTRKAKGRLKERHKARSTPGIVLPVIKEHLLAEMNNDDWGGPVIHASEMAKEDWCIRATYWRIIGRPDPPRKYDFVLENILAEGTAIHEKWQGWLKDTGYLWGDWKCAACGERVSSSVTPDAQGYSLQYGDGPWAQVADHECILESGHIWEYKEIHLESGLINGHADGAIKDTLIEFKSVGIGTLRTEANTMLQRYYLPEYKLYDLNALWKNVRRPFMSHLRQGNVYLWLAAEMGLPYEKMTFVYEFKPFQQVKEFTVTRSDRILAPLLDRAEKLTYAVETGKPPECEFGGCKRCQAYDGPAQERQGGGHSGHDLPGGRGRGQGPGERPAAGAAGAAASRPRRTTAATRAGGQGGHRADGAVQRTRRVVGLPGPAAEPGSGGRGAR